MVSLFYPTYFSLGPELEVKLYDSNQKGDNNLEEKRMSDDR